MSLPIALRQAIEAEAGRVPLRELSAAAAELSAKYRQPSASQTPFINSEVERVAYAATRLPATYAAARQVFAEVRRLLPDVRMNSLLDLGAGSGAASWAAVETFSELQHCTLFEQDAGLMQLGRTLTRVAEHEALRAADWQQANLARTHEIPAHDLIVCSYALGELEASAARQLIHHAWLAANRALIIIEPGTMRGFATVRAARAELLAAGAHLIAPCPHAQACPMPDNDWCHFAARVERSALQRRLKAGALGYEDEKFSYVAFAKWPVQPVAARVLRHPQRAPGHTQMQLCTAEGVRQVAITKRDKEAWRRVRKVNWGDAWDGA